MLLIPPIHRLMEDLADMKKLEALLQAEREADENLRKRQQDTAAHLKKMEDKKK